MAPPKPVKKNVTWFDDQLTPEQRLAAYSALSPRTRDLLKQIGYRPGTVPTELQMDALYNAVNDQATKALIRACSKAFCHPDLPNIDALLRALRDAEIACVHCDEKLVELAERVIQSAMERIELRAYQAFREFPSSERYGNCLATQMALERLGLERSTDYPVSPWPKCKVQPPLRPGLYVVVHGDTLSKISKRFYGEENLWDAIYESNGYEGHPDRIAPGLRLTIY